MAVVSPLQAGEGAHRLDLLPSEGSGKTTADRAGRLSNGSGVNDGVLMELAMLKRERIRVYAAAIANMLLLISIPAKFKVLTEAAFRDILYQAY